jgi:hypothetical protein
MITHFFKASVETIRCASVVVSHRDSAVCVSGATYDLTSPQHMRCAASRPDRGCIHTMRP